MATKKILIQIQVGAKDANIAVANVTKALEGLSSAQVKVSKNTKKTNASAGLHNAILMESGRLASDLNYGFTAIANNMGQLFSLFQASANSAGGLAAAFKKLLSIQALLLIGGQLLIQNLDKVGRVLKKLFFGVEDLGKIFNKASAQVKKVNGDYELYISTLQSSTKSDKEKAIAIEKLNKQYPDYIKSLNNANVSLEDVKNKTKEATEQNNLYRKSILELAISRAAQNEIEKISGEILQAEIDLKKVQFEAGLKTEEQLVQGIIDKKAEIAIEQESVRLKIEAQKDAAGRFASQTDIDTTRLKFLKDELLALEGNKKSYIGFGKTINEKIASLKEERALYIEYVRLGIEKNNVDKKAIEYQESTIGNTDTEIRLLLRLRDIRLKAQKDKIALQAKDANIDVDTKEKMDARGVAEVALVEKEREAALLKITDLKVSEGLKGQAILDTNKFYDELLISQANKRRIALDKINKLEAESKLTALDNIGKGLMSASKIAGAETGAGKALAVAGTLMSTYSSAQKAYESQLTATPDSPIRAVIAASAATLAGLANVKAIMAVQTPAMTGGTSVSGAGGAGNISAPDFNVVGAGGVSQLATGLAAASGRPIQAFVVSKEISSAQELDRNITSTATLG